MCAILRGVRELNRQALSRGGLIFIGILLALSAAEVSLRLWHGRVRMKSAYVASSAEDIVFRPKPNAYREINSLGFREHEYATQKPFNTFRIVVLGDSVTKGYGVKFEEMYTKRLEALLNRDRAEDENTRKFEVIGFGVSQYSTVQEVALFKEVGLSMRPDLVIVTYVLNDPTPDGSINDFFRVDRAPSMAWEWLIRRIRWALKLSDRQATLSGCRHFDYYSRMHCVAEKWAGVTTAMNELRELSAPYGFRVLLVILPLLEDGAEASFASYAWRHIHEQLAEAARANGFTSLDLLPHFARHLPAELKIAAGDKLHPNSLGHQIAAEAIHRSLVEMGVTAAPQG
jgi:lysophospholipase L1-like esterase